MKTLRSVSNQTPVIFAELHFRKNHEHDARLELLEIFSFRRKLAATILVYPVFIWVTNMKSNAHPPQEHFYPSHPLICLSVSKSTMLSHLTISTALMLYFIAFIILLTAAQAP